LRWKTTNVSDASQSNPNPKTSTSPQVPLSDSAILDAYSMAVIGVVEKVSPASISVSGRGSEARSGSGSGFIITPDGYAVTNSHVVAGRRQLLAETNEGDRVDVEVVGDDPATDIALLRMAARDLRNARDHYIGRCEEWVAPAGCDQSRT